MPRVPGPLLGPESLKKQGLWGTIAVVALLVLLLTATIPVAIGGDTPMYAGEIDSTLNHGWSDHILWNFAHLLWRPLGRLLAVLFLPLVLPHFNGNHIMAISFLMVLPNVVATLVSGIVLQRGVLRLTGSLWASILTVAAFFCLNPVLSYSRLGTPHLCGMACLALGIYLMGFNVGGSVWSPVLAGACGALAVGFWAPLLLTFPAILLAQPLLSPSLPRSAVIRNILLACVAGGAVTAGLYVCAMAIEHITTVQGFLAWIHESAPDSRDRKLTRMVNGLARGVYEMGDDAVWLKWYVFKDPYAHVTLADLVKASFIKLGMFYLSMLVLLLLLCRDAMGRRLLLLTAIAMIPNLVVAALYESGSVERYVPFLPVLFLAIGYAVGNAAFSPVVRALAVVICCAHIIPNLAAGPARSLTPLLQRDPARMSALTGLPSKDFVFVLNNRDPFVQFDYGDPLNPLHMQPTSKARVFVSMGPRVPFWHQDFACAVFQVWNTGGDAWVTRRVLAPAPKRDWLWVDNDITGFTWADLHQFLPQFQSTSVAGGDDGFFRIDHSSANQSQLLSITGGTTDGCLFH